MWVCHCEFKPSAFFVVSWAMDFCRVAQSNFFFTLQLKIICPLKVEGFTAVVCICINASKTFIPKSWHNWNRWRDAVTIRCANLGLSKNQIALKSNVFYRILIWTYGSLKCSSFVPTFVSQQFYSSQSAERGPQITRHVVNGSHPLTVYEIETDMYVKPLLLTNSTESSCSGGEAAAGTSHSPVADT